MLILRPEQLEAFWPAFEAAYTESISKHVAETHPDARVRVLDQRYTVADLPEGVLARMVRSGVARGHAYGLKDEASLREFVALMVTAAPNFDEYPPVREILADESIPVASRLERLREHISQKDWAMVKRYYDPEAWNVRSDNR
jgi:hypothetical protein